MDEVLNLDDVLVVDLVDGAGFMEEALDEILVLRMFRPQHLDGCRPAQRHVAGEEDAPHRAFAEEALQLVLPQQVALPFPDRLLDEEEWRGAGVAAPEFLRPGLRAVQSAGQGG
jgi:hypothetical protein